MNILVSRTESTVAHDLDLIRKFDPAFGADGLRYVLEYGRCLTPGSTLHNASNLYVRSAFVGAQRIALGGSIRLFRGAWAEALLAHLAAALPVGGKILMSVHDGKTGEWTIDDVAIFFGVPPTHGSSWLSRSEVVEVGIRRHPKPAASVLSWYLQHCDEILKAQIRQLSFAEAEQDTALASLEDARTGDADTGRDIPAAISTALRSQAYYVGGLSYKAAGLRHIHQAVAAGRPWRHLVDIGGGYGLLGAELLLDANVGVERTTTVDIWALNQVFHAILVKTLDKPEGKTMDFVLSAGQDYEFPSVISACSFVGSLLYVPQHLRAATIARAFSALEPGGVLIVHENIKTPSYTTDYDLMFEANELDALLSTHGPIRYFSSTALQELKTGAVANKTVFRVLQKTP